MIPKKWYPVEIWSDNGTYFKYAERELRESFLQLNTEQIQFFFTWKCIPILPVQTQADVKNGWCVQ